MTYNAAANLWVGTGDACDGVPDFPTYFKFAGGSWIVLMDFEDQAQYPPLCTAGDFGLINGSGTNGTMKRYFDCALSGPDAVTLQSCGKASGGSILSSW